MQTPACCLKPPGGIVEQVRSGVRSRDVGRVVAVVARVDVVDILLSAGLLFHGLSEFLVDLVTTVHSIVDGLEVVELALDPVVEVNE